MPDDMLPDQQPVSMHDNPHPGHGALPLIAAMLGVFLVLESIALAYFVTNYVGIQNVQSSILAKKAENEDSKPVFPPLLYANIPSDGGEIKTLTVVNRQTGRESVAFQAADDQAISLVAVPQVGYDGNVFISQQGGNADAEGLVLYKLNLATRDLTGPIEGLSGLASSAYAVSPDQTKIAFTKPAETNPTGNTLSIYNLLTGETEVVGDSGELAFWSALSDFDGQGTAYHLTWLDTKCVSATRYGLPDTDIAMTGSLPRYDDQTYCLQ